jgi:hypothetical protein
LPFHHTLHRNFSAQTFIFAVRRDVSIKPAAERETSGATAAQMMPSPLVLVRTLALAPIAERSARTARPASMAADRAIAEGAAAAAAVMDNVAKCPSTSLQSRMRWR